MANVNAPNAVGVLRLDRSYRRPGSGSVIVGGSPLRLFRLTEAGRAVAAALECDGDLPDGHRRLTDRLIDAGVVHPVLPTQAIEAAALTVVIPAFRELPAHLPGDCRCIVVDDASPEPVPERDGVVTVRLDHNIGPAGARNRGLAVVDTPFVAFVDSDVSITDSELLRLASHLGDPSVALVAPRVRAASAPGALAGYERHHSPLDMGAEPARVAAATRVSYVPAAVIVCRTDAVRAIGGFDERLRFGEDVDLVWRLVEGGWRCRFEPAVEALHRTRPTLRGWLAQRFRYGTSAAPLARRHPGALAPVRINGWSAATWIPVVAGMPLLGGLIGSLSAVLLVRKLPFLAARESLRIAALGNLYAGRLLAAAITRAWWPLAVVAALVSRRARRVLLAAVLVPALLDRRGQPSSVDSVRAVDPVRALVLRILDDGAYGAGLWAGAMRHRCVEVLLPSFTPFPPRQVEVSPAARAHRGGDGCRHTPRTRSPG